MNTMIRSVSALACALALTLLSSLPISAAERSSSKSRRDSAAMADASGSLSGKTFVIAGRLPTFTGAEAATLIEKAGGKVANSVGRGTQYLVAGSRPGAKLDDAKSLGVSVIDEAELRRMLGLPAAEPKKKKANK